MIFSALPGLFLPLGVYLLARSLHVPGAHALTAALGVSVLWVALACPVLAAQPDPLSPALLRSACALDAVVPAMLALWAIEPAAAFAGLARSYLALAAVALAGMAAARCARTAAGRLALAVAAATLLAALLAAPFAVGGLMRALPTESARAVLTWLYHANPFVSITMALHEQTHVVWPTTGWLYWVSDSGSYPAPAPSPWYACPLLFLTAALLLSVVAFLRRRRLP